MAYYGEKGKGHAILFGEKAKSLTVHPSTKGKGYTTLFIGGGRGYALEHPAMHAPGREPRCNCGTHTHSSTTACKRRATLFVGEKRKGLAFYYWGKRATLFVIAGERKGYTGRGTGRATLGGRGRVTLFILGGKKGLSCLLLGKRKGFNVY